MLPWSRLRGDLRNALGDLPPRGAAGLLGGERLACKRRVVVRSKGGRNVRRPYQEPWMPKMRSNDVLAERPAFDSRTFECPKCYDTETFVASISHEINVSIGPA